VLDLIRADLGHNHPVEALAEQAGLSPSRLQHLFAEEIGLPLRTFRIWVRLRQAGEQMAAGETVTSAALDAGFSNSSHFSHAFKETFGVTAASLFKNAPIRLELVGPPGT
jgi:AraC-like DNA-binding protein